MWSEQPWQKVESILNGAAAVRLMSVGEKLYCGGRGVAKSCSTPNRGQRHTDRQRSNERPYACVFLWAIYLLSCFLIVGPFLFVCYLWRRWPADVQHVFVNVWEYMCEVDSGCYNDYPKSEQKIGEEEEGKEKHTRKGTDEKGKYKKTD